MRSTAVLAPQDRPTLHRPITGARAAIWLSAGALGIALGLNLGLPLPHPDRTSRGMAQVNEASVGVVLFPDLSGVGDFGADCAGCDGLFESGDLLFAQRDPLPRLDVSLTDATGSSLTMRTRTLVPGRQSTLFRVDAPGAFTVTLPALPAGWQLCPNATRPHRVAAADFDAATKRADIVIAVAHGCRRADATATVTVTETAPAATAVPADATAIAEATSDAAATDVPPSPTAAPDAGPGADAADGASTADVANEDLAMAPVADASLALGADAQIAVHLPQTGLAGRSPLGRPIGLALLAIVAAALGEGGRRLHARRLPPRSGRWPRRAR